MSVKKPNHLIHEKSPYLQQHVHNPVDWFPWGAEAFEKARRENKPILVSIGYSTCHWCHVMERESYENEQLAALMNDYLVNIKVDREERPDIDKIYMTAVSAMTGSGGWPLNVFLTPDLKPFYGGTYFPPVARWGVPGWGDVVTQVGRSWNDPERRKKMLEAGEHLANALRQYATAASTPAEGDPAWIAAGIEALRGSYDRTRGGFGSAPKFPMPVYHHFLLRAASLRHDEPALQMSLYTLKEMAKGGIYDHLGGGFARYSTDANWHIPHFEKMLYDNAQLAVNYLDAYQITQDAAFERVARETLDYVLRDMTAPEGGFYSAEDADSLPHRQALQKVEGAFYVWEKQEIVEILGEDSAQIVNFAYGVRDGGNAAHDPHGEFQNKNILYRAHPTAEAARHFKMTEDRLESVLEQARRNLFAARSKRPRPHLDEKVISAWNGLMMSGFARGYQVLGDKTYLHAAQKAAFFLNQNLYDAPGRRLFRRWRDGERKIRGIADDYAFVVQGLLDLYEADFDAGWIAWARDLANSAITQFFDSEQGGFFMTAPDQDPHLLIRVKEDQDNVEPSASSVWALNLLRLAEYTGAEHFAQLGRKTIRAFATTLSTSPKAMLYLLNALEFASQPPRQVIVAGEKGAPDTEALLREVHSRFIPNKVIMLADSKAFPFLHDKPPINGRAAAYICQNLACQQPVTDPLQLAGQLKN